MSLIHLSTGLTRTYIDFGCRTPGNILGNIITVIKPQKEIHGLAPISHRVLESNALSIYH